MFLGLGNREVKSLALVAELGSEPRLSVCSSLPPTPQLGPGSKPSPSHLPKLNRGPSASPSSPHVHSADQGALSCAGHGTGREVTEPSRLGECPVERGRRSHPCQLPHKVKGLGLGPPCRGKKSFKEKGHSCLFQKVRGLGWVGSSNQEGVLGPHRGWGGSPPGTQLLSPLRDWGRKQEQGMGQSVGVPQAPEQVRWRM